MNKNPGHQDTLLINIGDLTVNVPELVSSTDMFPKPYLNSDDNTTGT